jgi:hypothetical protein
VGQKSLIDSMASFAVSLNDHHIFDDIFSEEYMMDIIGALECEYSFPP